MNKFYFGTLMLCAFTIVLMLVNVHDKLTSINDHADSIEHMLRWDEIAITNN